VITFVIENTTQKDIKAFKFKDLFGEVLKESDLVWDDGIKAGEKRNWTGYLKYNQFMSEGNKFAFGELENMKFEWIPSSIIFKDGTKIGE